MALRPPLSMERRCEGRTATRRGILRKRGCRTGRQPQMMARLTSMVLVLYVVRFWTDDFGGGGRVGANGM